MARAAKLGTTNVGGITYWVTKAGGKTTYFGRTDEVSRKHAETAFADHLKTIRTETSRQRDLRVGQAVTVWELCDRFNEWTRANRSLKTFRYHRNSLQNFCNYRVMGTGSRGALYGVGQPVGELSCDRVTLPHAKEFIGTIEDPCTKLHHTISIKRGFNWAADPLEAEGGALLPENYRPFKHLARPHVPLKNLSEADLITDAEHMLLVEFAGEEYHNWPKCNEVVRDLLVLMLHTGPRTSEPLDADVRDFNRRTHQLTLGKHKRSTTQRDATLRQLTLNKEAYAIVAKHCQGKSPSEPIFCKANGTRFTQEQINERLRQVKAVIKQQAEQGQLVGKVRDEITPYSYRDLYISELLMAGVPVFKVSKMAGTSIEMIERTYAHFFVDDLMEAQAQLDRARRQRRAKTKRLRDVG